MNASVLRVERICRENSNNLIINTLNNRKISVSNSIDFGIQSHWVWLLKSLGLESKSMEIEIQAQ